MVRKTEILAILLYLGLLIIPILSIGQEHNQEGWPIPDLKDLVPYSMTVQSAEGVEKIVEKFYTSNGGHIARVSGNGKVFAYIVDTDQEPPIDYFLIDPDGSGKFTQKFGPNDSYFIPNWIFQ